MVTPASSDDPYAAFPDNPEAYREATWNATARSLFLSAVRHAEKRIQWYEARSSQRARVAKGIRWWALFLFAVGTLTPILLTFLVKAAAVAGIGGTDKTKWNPIDWIAAVPLAEIGYVLLAVAGALVVFDQFFDASGSWIRFRQSQARLEVLLADFRFSWAEMLTKCGGSFSNRAMAVEAAVMLRAFVSKVEILAEEETKEWATRFNARIEAFDRNPNLKVRLDASEGGKTPAAEGAEAFPSEVKSKSAATGQAASADANPLDDGASRSVFIRLAVDDADTLDSSSLQLLLNEVPIPIPSNGLVELPLEIGDAHRIVATGRRNGRAVRGEVQLTPNAEDEGRPVELTLA